MLSNSRIVQVDEGGTSQQEDSYLEFDSLSDFSKFQISAQLLVFKFRDKITASCWISLRFIFVLVVIASLGCACA